MGNNYRVIYCSTVWGSMGKGLSNKVKKFQNIGTWLLLWLTMNAQVPEYNSKMFVKSNDVHSYL